MSEMITVPMAAQRDIKTVTTEIRTLTSAAQRMALEYAIEIGRRLCEAKSMLPHGEWGEWLKTEVEFSQSTANNLMKLFDEYAADQIGILGATPKSQTLGNLNYTKALRLLAVPSEEREIFAETVHAEHLSTRELEEAIKARQAAEERAKLAETEKENAGKERDEAQAARDKLTAEKAAAEERLKKVASAEASAKAAEKAAKAELENMKQNPQVSPEKLQELQKAAEEKALAAFAAEKGRMEKELAEKERAAQAAQKELALAAPELAVFREVFKDVQESFHRLLGLLQELHGNAAEDKLRSGLRALLQAWENKLG